MNPDRSGGAYHDVRQADPSQQQHYASHPSKVGGYASSNNGRHVALTSNVRVEDTERWTMASLWFIPFARFCFIAFIFLSPFPGFFVTDSDYHYVGDDHGKWGGRVTVIGWVVLVCLFFSAFSHYLKYYPLLSGRPKELLRVIPECRGNVAVTLVSPFVDEDHSVFLRSLLGRSLTVFHTVSNVDHKLKGLYVDAILNEERRKGVDEYRKSLWKAWNSFLLEIILISSDIDPETLECNSNTVEISIHSIQRIMKFLTMWLESVEHKELYYNYSLSVHATADADM
jgi:hypothetical protein